MLSGFAKFWDTSDSFTGRFLLLDSCGFGNFLDGYSSELSQPGWHVSGFICFQLEKKIDLDMKRRKQRFSVYSHRKVAAFTFLVYELIKLAERFLSLSINLK